MTRASVAPVYVYVQADGKKEQNNAGDQEIVLVERLLNTHAEGCSQKPGDQEYKFNNLGR